MNSLNRINSIKVAVLVATAGISALISLPASAQSNPRPSIFKEPPYNRSYGPPQGPQPNRQSGQGHQPGHGHHKHHQLGQGPTSDNAGSPAPLERGHHKQHPGRGLAAAPQSGVTPSNDPRLNHRRPADNSAPAYDPGPSAPPANGPQLRRLDYGPTSAPQPDAPPTNSPLPGVLPATGPQPIPVPVPPSGSSPG